MLTWKPIAVGQLVASSNVWHDEGSPLPYRVTLKFGEGDWVAYFDGWFLGRGNLLHVLRECERSEEGCHGTTPREIT